MKRLRGAEIKQQNLGLAESPEGGFGERKNLRVNFWAQDYNQLLTRWKSSTSGRMSESVKRSVRKDKKDK